jgi:uncharacterized coiled-coil protein SlyX
VSPRAIKLTAITLLVAVAVGAAATISYFVQQQRIDQLRAELVQQKSEVSKQKLKIEALMAQLAQAADAPTAPTPPEPTNPSGASEPNSKPAAKSRAAKQFAFVTKATEKGGAIKLSLDYAQFLTGDAAARAAADAGGESPPPNDYYIVNSNTKIRVLPVASGARFTVALSSPDDTRNLSAGQFLDVIANNTDGAADAPYWFTIKSGVVTGGTEQWTP